MDLDLIGGRIWGAVAGNEDRDESDELVIEVDGEGVHVQTLDAARTLELAVSYLLLLQRVAEDRGESIVFTGLAAREKCGQLATHASDPEIARQAALDAFQLLSSWDPPPRGLSGVLDRTRAARAALPPHYTAFVKVRGFERPIAAEPSSALRESPRATASIRAVVVRVGGARPRATFKSKSERRTFSLDLRGEDQATELSPYLYMPVDLVARVVRDSSGYIEAGALNEFYPISDLEPRRAWADWFRESGLKSLDELEAIRNEGKKGGGRDGSSD